MSKKSAIDQTLHKVFQRLPKDISEITLTFNPEDEVMYDYTNTSIKYTLPIIVRYANDYVPDDRSSILMLRNLRVAWVMAFREHYLTLSHADKTTILHKLHIVKKQDDSIDITGYDSTATEEGCTLGIIPAKVSDIVASRMCRIIKPVIDQIPIDEIPENSHWISCRNTIVIRGTIKFSKGVSIYLRSKKEPILDMPDIPPITNVHDSDRIKATVRRLFKERIDS